MRILAPHLGAALALGWLAGCADPPGESAGRIETRVSSHEVGAGDAVEVRCLLEGRVARLHPVALEVTPPPQSLSRAGEVFTVGFTARGTYELRCRTEDGALRDETGAAVTVHPGLPASWIVELATRACHSLALGLPLDVQVFDHWGNPLGDDVVEVRASGVALPLVAEGRYALPGEGDFVIEVVPLGPTHDGLPIPFEPIPVRVDSTPPAIEIASPERAGRLAAGTVSPAGVRITGSATDAVSNLVSLVVNDTPQVLPAESPSAAIDVDQSARWGMNVVTATAEDACGNRASVVQSYLRSGSFYPDATAAETSARTSGGFVSHLNQPIFDDGNRADADDLATVGEALIQATDFDALVPPGTDFASDPLRAGCSFCDFWADTAYLVERDPSNRARIGWSGPWIVQLRVIDGGLWVWAELATFDFPLRVWGTSRECACGVQVGGPTMDVRGWAGADLVEVWGPVGVSLSSSAAACSAAGMPAPCPVVNVPALNVNSTGLYLDVACPAWADWLCDLTSDTIVPLLADLVEDALADVVAGELEPLLEGFLGGLRLEPTLSLPPPLGRPDGSPDVHAVAALERLRFCGPAGGLARPAGCPATSPTSGYGQIDLAVQLHPPGRGDGIPMGAGAIRRNPACTSPTGGPCLAGSGFVFGAGLSDDLVNQLLWSTWYGGALHLGESDVALLAEGAADLTGISVHRIGSLAPPVLMPGYGSGDVDLGWGDLRIEATVDLAALGAGGEAPGLLDVTLQVSALLSGSVVLDPATNRLSVDLAGDPQLRVQVLEIDDPAHHDLVRDLFVERLPPLLARAVDATLGSLPLPRFELSAVAGFPPGTAWELANGAIARETPGSIDLEDYHRLTGDLR